MLNLKARLWQFFFCIVIIICVMPLNFCTKVSRRFDIEILKLKLDIEELQEGLYRIYIYRALEDKGEDYIDINYRMSEMPSITLCFPLETSNVINVTERMYSEVSSYKSKTFIINYPKIDEKDFKEITKYMKWRDSVRLEVPSITVRVDAYLEGLSVWNGEHEYVEKIYPQE